MWSLVVDAPETLCDARCEAVTTERVGEPRLVPQAYEQPDGSAVDLTTDIAGAHHVSRIIPGPFAALRPGRQTIPVWSMKKQ